MSPCFFLQLMLTPPSVFPPPAVLIFSSRATAAGFCSSPIRRKFVFWVPRWGYNSFPLPGLSQSCFSLDPDQPGSYPTTSGPPPFFLWDFLLTPSPPLPIEQVWFCLTPLIIPPHFIFPVGSFVPLYGENLYIPPLYCSLF